MGKVTPAEIAEAYEGTRRRVDELVRGRDDLADLPVAACPQWRVRDLVAHLAGVAEDAIAGRLDGVATDPWTAAQVDRHRDEPLNAVLDAWAAAAGPLGEAMRAGIGAEPIAVFDTVTHEHDLRAAVGQPGARATDAIRIGSAFAARALVGNVAGQGLPPLRIVATDGRAWGPDDAVATLTASAWDLLRSCSGRRTEQQVADLDWGGADPQQYLPAFSYGPFTPPAEPVEVPEGTAGVAPGG